MSLARSASTAINIPRRGDERARPGHPAHIRLAAEALTDEFTGIYSQETIERFIAESLDLLGETRINVFVPVLAHRFARERLRRSPRRKGGL